MKSFIDDNKLEKLDSLHEKIFKECYDILKPKYIDYYSDTDSDDDDDDNKNNQILDTSEDDEIENNINEYKIFLNERSLNNTLEYDKNDKYNNTLNFSPYLILEKFAKCKKIDLSNINIYYNIEQHLFDLYEAILISHIKYIKIKINVILLQLDSFQYFLKKMNETKNCLLQIQNSDYIKTVYFTYCPYSYIIKEDNNSSLYLAK